MSAPAEHPDPGRRGDHDQLPGRQQLAVEPSDDELMRRLDDVLDRVDPTPDSVVADAKAAYASYAAAPADASAGQVPPCLPVEAPKPAGGAAAPIPAAPPAHHLRLTPWQRVLQRLLDLIGRPA